MKKIIIITLTLLLAIGTFAGCQSEDAGGNTDPIESYDNVSVFTPEGNEDKTETESTPENTENSTVVTGNIVAKDKRYVYKGNDFVIINLENQTETNYVVTITGTYFDKNGTELRTETQTFDQFAAGNTHYFLFHPEMQFEKFKYSFTVEETNEIMYINDVEYDFGGLVEGKWPVDELTEQGDNTFYPMIQALCGFKNHRTDRTSINVEWTSVILNDRGEVIFIRKFGKLFFAGDQENYSTPYIYYTTEDKLVWPEEMKGEIYSIGCITSVEKRGD